MREDVRSYPGLLMQAEENLKGIRDNPIRELFKVAVVITKVEGEQTKSELFQIIKEQAQYFPELKKYSEEKIWEIMQQEIALYAGENIEGKEFIEQMADQL